MLNSRCAGCGEPGVDLCRRCRFTLIAAPPITTATGIVAATQFSGLGRELVVGLKYRNRRRLAMHLAEQLSRRLDSTQIDVITWAPTTRSHVRKRGYDQAELLARALGALWRKPCRRMLFRHHGPSQTGRNRAERLHGPDFGSRPMRRPPRVLVIDDVVTTGATLFAARDALLAAGAASVVLAAVAATPDHVVVRPTRRSTSMMAGALSTSTSTPVIPIARAASTFDSTSSKKTARSGVVLSLVAAR